MLIDKRLDELLKYKGTNPKPNDFDEYWAKAIGELDDLGLEYQLEPSQVQFKKHECLDLYFTGTKGVQIHAKYIRPRGDGEFPVVFKFHGYMYYSGDWKDNLSLAAGADCAVVAIDCRGQGGLTGEKYDTKGTAIYGNVLKGLADDKESLYYRDVFLDTLQVTRIVANFEEIDEDRMGTTGQSQGGALAIVCAGLNPNIKYCAVSCPFLSDYEKIYEMGIGTEVYQLQNFFRFYDPEHKRHDEIFKKLGYIDIQNFADKIKARVLLGTGLKDGVCPPETQFAMYNKIQSEKNVHIYPDFVHEYFAGYEDKIIQFFMEL